MYLLCSDVRAYLQVVGNFVSLWYKTPTCLLREEKQVRVQRNSAALGLECNTLRNLMARLQLGCNDLEMGS